MSLLIYNVEILSEH